MSRNATRTFAAFSLCAATLALAGPAAAQFPAVTLPFSGDNQKSTVTQTLGLVQVGVAYSSPDVHAPGGADRRGKIWGELVPYGMTDLGFGTCGDQCPWRGGANENTVFTTSHDIQVQGQPLPAGSYGLHFIPGADQWTVIFSKNHTSWGSYFYDPKEDALRVQVKPEKAPYTEWLTYDFTDRRPDKATLALRWEELQVPIQLAVPNIVDLYIANLRNELRSSAGFTWTNWNAAAQYALQNKTNLVEAERWAEQAVNAGFGGQASFTTLSTLGQLQAANGKQAEAAKTMEQALNHPSATAAEIHQYGRQLQMEGKNEEAMKVFELNAKKNPNQWPTELGLARGHFGLNRKAQALEHARKALTQAPTGPAKQNVEAFIQEVERSK